LVLCLPPDVGNLERHRDRGAGQEPAVQDQLAAAAEQGADEHRAGEKARAVIVGQPEAGDQSAGQPPAAVAGPPDPGDDERQARPRQHLVGRRVGHMSAPQQDRHRGSPDCGQQLHAPATTELARGQPADHHRGPRRERGPHAQAGRRQAEQRQRYSRQ
jgi:hypothetical protein